MDVGAVLQPLLFLAIFFAMAGFFVRRAWYLYSLVRVGATSAGRTDAVGVRAGREVTGVLFQSKLWLRPVPGLMHLFLFWGFLVLLPTIVMSFLGAMNVDWTIPWLGEAGWFALLVDLFAVGTLIGVTIAFTIRLGQRPTRFVGSYLQVAYNILLFEGSIVLTLFIWHGSRIALGINEAPAEWTPVSTWVAGLLAGLPGLEVIERVSVWIHALLILAFLVYIPYTKHLHTLVAPINVYFGRTRNRGRLEPLEFENPDIPEDKIRFGTGTIKDLTWKQMVDAMACTECGRCQDYCPAFATGKDLSPKLVVMGIRDQLYREGHGLLASLKPAAEGQPAPAPFEGQPVIGTAVKAETMWDCVTCGACVRECPVGIEHIDHIIDLRRNQVMVEAAIPAAGAQMMRDLERQGNPWGGGPDARVEWTAGLDVPILNPGDPAPEYLYFVGCAAAYDERARVAARSTAKLLKQAGVDFAILGASETCCGDPARRMGDEYTYQAYAKGNIETFASSGVTKILTACPHCFNSLANEYKDFGGTYQVLHHTEVLAGLVEDGKLKPQATDEQITYHDSCYLARHNDVREAPRTIVSAVGQKIEMARREERTFCCGAGGAHMWLEERGNQINEERARQAAATGATTLAVACPFCTVMLGDGVQTIGADLAVKDVATLLVEAVERGQERPPVPAVTVPAEGVVHPSDTPQEDGRTTV